VRIILKCGFNLNTTNKYTPLDVAVKSGHKEVTSWWLQCGANVNTVDNDGKTPFILAAEKSLV
jgi:ankyrin repeat protein